MSESLHTEIKQAIVRSLRLPMESESRSATRRRCSDLMGSGLDSVDVLELVLEIERSFGVAIEDQDTGMQALRNVESIGAFIRERRASRRPERVRNALTVDVEEWFHICGVPELGPAQWEGLESRVELTTRRLLDCFDAAGARATFFVVGWVAERHPQLVAEIAAAGHQVGSHGYLHERAYDLGEAGFREDLRRSVAALGAIANGRPVSGRRSGRSTIDRSGRWTCSPLKVSPLMPVWRRCGSLAARPTRGPRISATAAGRSSRCRRLLPIASAT